MLCFYVFFPFSSLDCLFVFAARSNWSIGRGTLYREAEVPFWKGLGVAPPFRARSRCVDMINILSDDIKNDSFQLGP